MSAPDQPQSDDVISVWFAGRWMTWDEWKKAQIERALPRTKREWGKR